MQNGEDLFEEDKTLTGQGGLFQPALTASPHGKGQGRKRDGAEDKMLQ